jgi:hypothetical protein
LNGVYPFFSCTNHGTLERKGPTLLCSKCAAQQDYQRMEPTVAVPSQVVLIGVLIAGDDDSLELYDRQSRLTEPSFNEPCLPVYCVPVVSPLAPPSARRSRPYRGTLFPNPSWSLCTTIPLHWSFLHHHVISTASGRCRLGERHCEIVEGFSKPSIDGF